MDGDAIGTGARPQGLHETAASRYQGPRSGGRPASGSPLPGRRPEGKRMRRRGGIPRDSGDPAPTAPPSAKCQSLAPGNTPRLRPPGDSGSTPPPASGQPRLRPPLCDRPAPRSAPSTPCSSEATALSRPLDPAQARRPPLPLAPAIPAPVTAQRALPPPPNPAPTRGPPSTRRGGG